MNIGVAAAPVATTEMAVNPLCQRRGPVRRVQCRNRLTILATASASTRAQVYLSGTTSSADLQTTQGAAQTSLGGATDAFVIKLDVPPPNNTITFNPAQARLAGPARETVPPASLSVVVAAGARPNWSLEVATATGGNWLDATPRSGSASATVTVSANTAAIANLPEGTYNGTITLVNSTLNTRTAIPVTLALTQPAGVFINTGILHSATQQPASAVPGLAMAVFGRYVGPTELVRGKAVEGVLPTTLADVRVLFDEVPSALSYVSAGQVAFFVPYAVASRLETRMVIEYRGVRSVPLALAVGKTAPGIFTADSSGKGQATAKNEDGSDNNEGNSAGRDATVTIIATGEGETDPDGVDGKVAVDDTVKPTAQVALRIGGELAEITAYGSIPGLPAGYFAVTAKIPPSAPGGNVPVQLTVASDPPSASSPLATIVPEAPRPNCLRITLRRRCRSVHSSSERKRTRMVVTPVDVSNCSAIMLWEPIRRPAMSCRYHLRHGPTDAAPIPISEAIITAAVRTSEAELLGRGAQANEQEWVPSHWSS